MRASLAQRRKLRSIDEPRLLPVMTAPSPGQQACQGCAFGCTTHKVRRSESVRFDGPPAVARGMLLVAAMTSLVVKSAGPEGFFMSPCTEGRGAVGCLPLSLANVAGPCGARPSLVREVKEARVQRRFLHQVRRHIICSSGKSTFPTGRIAS